MHRERLATALAPALFGRAGRDLEALGIAYFAAAGRSDVWAPGRRDLPGRCLQP